MSEALAEGEAAVGAAIGNLISALMIQQVTATIQSRESFLRMIEMLNGATIAPGSLLDRVNETISVQRAMLEELKRMQ